MKPATQLAAQPGASWAAPTGCASAAAAVVATELHKLPPATLTVLFVHQSGELYGSDRMLLATTHALQRAGGHAIVFLPSAGPLLQALLERGIECHVLSDTAVIKLTRAGLSVRGLFGLLTAVPRAWRQWGRCIAGRPVHLVVSNTMAVLGGVPLAWRCAAPHLWHVHEIVENPRWAAPVFPWLAQRFAHRVVCNSRATQRSLLWFQPALATRSCVVWNGTPDPRRAAAATASLPPLRQAFRPQGLPLAVGLVGRINRMKGHQLLLEAACALRQRGIENFSLVFVGDTPPGQQHHLHQLQQRAAALGLSGRVVFTGFMAQTAAAYAALDIVCMPSTEAESFGLVAIEAMAMSLPVVASCIGGLPELVVHGHTGLLHKAGDAQALADVLTPLLQNPLLRLRMGQAGRKRWEQLFDINAMDRHIVAELQQAANVGHHGARQKNAAGARP